MGNNKPVAKRKKKGRPSLLDLQKRTLRLQKQQQNTNPNPKSNNTIPNPYLKFPNTTRRTTRRSANLDGDDEDEAEEEEEDDEGAPNVKRKEKKLKLVLTIPNGSEDPAASGSDSDGNGEGSRKKRKIDSLQTGRQNSSSKATDPRQGAKEEPSDSGPTTPLPDKKLLEFILDRLQKKDTYGVFSDPVDPEELPDYHDIIKHPMDFATVRSKLSSGAYACLEQFESDVFLITSNAMCYNAPDTIYYRQARSIQELAKKDFENLRQESDDNEPEPPTVRRGRPPIKNTIKRMLGKTPADRTGSDFSSNATLANARDDTRVNSTNDLIRKGSSFDKMSMVDSSTRASHALRYNETHRSNGDRSEYLGSSLKGTLMRNWKKQTVIDENRRDTYNQPIPSTYGQEPSMLTVFDWERKLLVPVGFHVEHSYARSLARFAANLGPVAWEIAAKKIERTLPSGTKFGRGWVGDSEAPQLHPPLLSTSPQLSMQTKLSHCMALSGGNKLVESHEPSSSDLALPPSALASVAPTSSRSSDSMDGAEACKLVNHESKLDLVESGVGPKSHSQICKNSAPQPSMNGFNPGFTVNLPSQAGNSATQTKPPEEVMAHARVINMVSRNANNNFANHQVPMTQVNAEEKTRLVAGNQNTVNPGNTLLHADYHSKVRWQAFSLNPKPGPIPPDLNVDLQSPVSPASGVLADTQQQQQPDLALQL